MNNDTLQGIGFENFRIFKQQTLLDFAPLTVLTGTNSSGKSTIISGLKLIQDGFKEVPEVQGSISDTNPLILSEKLFSGGFHSGEMLKRYGYLRKYISFPDKEGQLKNVFRFAIPVCLTIIEEQAYIEYTITLEDNDLNTGLLTNVDIKLCPSDKSIFSIDTKLKGKGGVFERNSFTAKIDLMFFYEKFVQLLNDKTFVSGTLNKMWKDGHLYNFPILWEDDANDEALFQYAVKRYYNTFDKDTLHLITHDIIQLLSENEWKNEYNFQLAFTYSQEKGVYSVFSSVSHAENLRKKYLKYSDSGNEIPNKDYNKLEYNKIEDLNNKKDFLEYLISVIYNKNKWEGMEGERYFFENFVTPNLVLIQNTLLPFKTMESVSSERANTKGFKSILDADDFSRLVKKYFSATSDYEKEAYIKLEKFLKKWLNEFKIADDIQFEKEKDYEIFKVKLIKNGREMMLSDEGFGVSQVLPVILSCCPVVQDIPDDQGGLYRGNAPRLVLIEEPETNLHPALQSKLADMFMDAVKTFNIRFVLETHSEYLVRKLQYLTGKGDIKPEDTVIYYFYPPTEVPLGEEQVKKINIQQDGSLTDDFGTGFFDEATNWKFELLALKNHQKN